MLAFVEELRGHVADVELIGRAAIGSGVLRVDADARVQRNVVERLRSRSDVFRHVVVLRAPPALKQQLDVWGPLGDAGSWRVGQARARPERNSECGTRTGVSPNPESSESLTPNPARAFSGPDQPSMALIDACVHCGFCLPTCPTYVLWNEEMDTPRGRVYLMKAGLDGRAAMTPTFVSHFDACLGCMACVTACPSGVQYGPLIERTRAQIERHYDRPFGERLFRSALFAVLPYPARLRLVMAPLLILGPILRALERRGLLNVLPARVRSLIAVAPQPSLGSLLGNGVPEHTVPTGTSRLRAGVLTGCVQRLAFAGVNKATIDVLAAEGCTVEAPSAQGCCGALALHAAHRSGARAREAQHRGVRARQRRSHRRQCSRLRDLR